MTGPTKDTIASEGTPSGRPSTVDDLPDFAELDDDRLAVIVRRLNRAARDAAHLPASAACEQVTTAAAIARVELRRRRLHASVADGLAALREVAP